MKEDLFGAFSLTVAFISCIGRLFHRDLSAAAMSTDMSQVCVAFFPSFSSFHLSRFPFYINTILDIVVF
jgi:hypothetical protein